MEEHKVIHYIQMTFYTIACSVLAGLIVYFITLPVRSRISFLFKKKDDSRNRRLENFYNNLPTPSEKLPSFKNLKKKKND